MVETIFYAAMIAVEAVVAWIYCEHFFEKKRRLWLHLSCFFIAYALLFAISQYGNTTLNSVSFGIINVLLFSFTYQVKYRTAILHAAFLCFVMLMSEVIVSLVINLYGYDFSEYTHNVSIMIVLGIWSKLLYLVLAVIGSWIFSPHQHENEEPKFLVLFCVLPVISAILAAVIIYIGMHSEVNQTTSALMTLNVAALLIINVLFLSIYNHIQKMNAEHLRTQLSIQKENADVLYYQALQEQSDSQRILIHDIKNHMHTIRALAEQHQTDAVAAYLSQLDDTILSIPQARLCNEPILNVLLLRFADDCRKENVNFQCDVRDNCLSFMDATSITTLFSNLLSNALEAAKLSEERQIELIVKRSAAQAAVIVTVVNSCDTPPVADSEGMFITRKKDRTLHGVGLKSIQRIVNKHNGLSTARYVAEDRQFHHVIHFSQQTSNS